MAGGLTVSDSTGWSLWLIDMNCSLGILEAVSGWSCPAVVPGRLVTYSVNEAADHNADIELLQRIARGDRDAFSRFYDLYSNVLFSIAFRVLNDQKEAEDVLQESFLQIWEKAPTYKPQAGKPFSWALTITRNKAIDRIRFLQRQSRLVESATNQAEPAAEVVTVRESVFGREKAELIRLALTGLPSDQKQAIELAFFSGLTQHEISAALREPLGTVKTRIRRGMLKLRDSLEGLL